MYQDGLKLFTFNYTDAIEDPLPATTFERIILCSNMRGLLTDLQIFGQFMDQTDLSSWTTKCGNKEGDIFSWKKEKINITQVTIL